MRKLRIMTGCLAASLFMIFGMSRDVFAVEKNADIPVNVSQSYVVAQDGSGQFVTITEAIAQAKSGDVVYVMPGVYEECIKLYEKEIQLIGVDPNLCIIQNCLEDYHNPPMEIASGLVKNLTIRAYRVEEEAQGVGSPSVHDVTYIEGNDIAAIYGGMIPIDSFSGYAVHIESANSYGRELTFENCILTSSCNYVVGAGIRGGSTLRFRNCAINGIGYTGALYLHDTDGELGGDANVIFEGTRISSQLAPYLLSVYSVNPENHIGLTFQNVNVSAVVFQNREIYSVSNHYTGAMAWELMNHLTKRLTLSETLQYLTWVRTKGKEGTDQSGNNCILYLLDAEQLRGLPWEEAVKHKYVENPLFVNRKRTMISIWNQDGRIGTGWCGAESFFLTPNSVCNQYPDFNVIPVMQEPLTVPVLQ